MVPGLGVGLTITFTLSALRILAPSATVWLPLFLVGGAVGFVLGYLTPAPPTDDDDDDDDDLEVLGDEENSVSQAAVGTSDTETLS